MINRIVSIGLFLSLISSPFSRAVETALKDQSGDTGKPIGIFYFNKMFGHIHQNAIKTSSSITTVACGHPLKVLNIEEASASKWYVVLVGDMKGYVLSENLSEKVPDCFQDKYPKFFNALNLDMTDMYYWGRLYDHFSPGESKVK